MILTEPRVYPTQPRPLQAQIAANLNAASPDVLEGDITALIVPASNQLQGGAAAAEAYALLQGRHYDTVILIGPSHGGSSARINICSVDTYHTPLGDVQVSDGVRHELCDEDDDIFVSDEGHFHVEGIDVQVPYLQTVLDDFDIVPVVMGEESPAFCRELGQAVGEVMYNRRALVIAAADVVAASEEDYATFCALVEAQDVSRLMSLLNSGEVQVNGKGALLVALLACMHRTNHEARILTAERPGEGFRGAFSAALWRN